MLCGCNHGNRADDDDAGGLVNAVLFCAHSSCQLLQTLMPYIGMTEWQQAVAWLNQVQQEKQMHVTCFGLICYCIEHCIDEQRFDEADNIILQVHSQLQQNVLLRIVWEDDFIIMADVLQSFHRKTLLQRQLHMCSKILLCPASSPSPSPSPKSR